MTRIYFAILAVIILSPFVLLAVSHANGTNFNSDIGLTTGKIAWLFSMAYWFIIYPIYRLIKKLQRNKNGRPIL